MEDLTHTPWPLLGAAMRSARLANGMSLDLLARRVSASKADLARFECGQVKISRALLDTLAGELRLIGPATVPQAGDSVCGWCGGAMSVGRSTRRFCDATCRQACHRAGKARARRVS